MSNLQPHHCLLNRVFRRRSKKTSKLRVTGLCAGNSPVTGEFPAQMTHNAINVSIGWSHHLFLQCDAHFRGSTALEQLCNFLIFHNLIFCYCLLITNFLYISWNTKYAKSVMLLSCRFIVLSWCRIRVTLLYNLQAPFIHEGTNL